MPGARRRSRRGVVAAALLGLAAAAVVLAAILGSGSSPSSHRRHAASGGHRPRAAGRPPHASSSSPASGARTSAAGSAAPAPATPSTAAAQPAAGSPVAAVESFYRLAAAHRYSDAWALADPMFREQLGGYSSFQSGQAGDRSISFNSARVVQQSGDAATVAVQTTSVRNDGTQHCAGTVDLVRGQASGGWLLHQIHINCS